MTVEQDVQIVDLRPLDEFELGFVRGSRCIALETINNPDTVHLLFPDLCRPIYVYCPSGFLSAEAALTLVSYGYESVLSIEGGFDLIKVQLPALIDLPKNPIPHARQLTNRYRRQTSLAELGIEGQKKLEHAHVTVVGVGGLGCPALTFLASAGVGQITFLDFDRVEASNLHRQSLHFETDLGRPKVESALEKLRQINSSTVFNAHMEYLSASNAERLIAPADLVIDASDNLETRFLVNATCRKLAKPFIFAGVFQFEGQLCYIDGREGPCLKCLFPVAPPPELAPDCQTAGVLGPFVGVMGAMQALEAIRILTTRDKKRWLGRLWLFNALTMESNYVEFSQNPDCEICGGL